MRKIIRYTTSTLIILFLLFLCFLAAISLYNSYLTNRFLNDLENIPLPKNSKIISSYKEFGVLYGAGNHCDCEIAAILESDMTVQEFKNYAKSLTLDGPFHADSLIELYHLEKQQLSIIDDENTTKFTYDIVALEWNEFFSEDPHILLRFRNMIKKLTLVNHKNYFIIMSINQTHEGINMNDIRCH